MITWDVEEFLTALGARHTLANLRTLLQHRLRTATVRRTDHQGPIRERSGGAFQGD
jgi:hypothetical protein